MKIDFKSPKKYLLPLNIITFNLCRLWPFRKKTLWVFGAREGHQFEDNSKYMFLHVLKNHPNIHAVWLTNEPKIVEDMRKQGYEAYRNGTLKGKWMQLRAGASFYTNGLMDFGFIPLVAGSKIVALWHGMGFKLVYNGKLHGKALFLKKTLDHLFSWTYRNITLATSQHTVHSLETNFTLKKSGICITGQPRNDVLFKVNRNQILNSIGIDEHKKAIIYMPTYRGKSLGEDAMGKILVDLYNSIELDKELNKDNAVLIAKLHPLTPHVDIQNRDNFIVLDYANVHGNQELMGACDELITDYSSCFVDYALLERPIIFYVPDEENFIKNSEDVEKEFYDICNINKTTTPKELADKLSMSGKEVAKATNDLFEDPRIKGTNYSENVYKAVVETLKIKQ